MIHLEMSLKGNPRIAKQMIEHLPGKTAKQIRDKRKEPSYKTLLKQYSLTYERPVTSETLNSSSAGSDSEIEIQHRYRRRCISETEDENNSDKGEATRQLSPSSQVNETAAPVRESAAQHEQVPDLPRLANDVLTPSRRRAADRDHAVDRT